jgi:hypothetical protein
MPSSISVAAFVLGAILLLVALVGGGFKLFGAEIPVGASDRNRVVAMVLGLALIGGTLWFGRQPDGSPPSPVPVIAATAQAHVADVFIHATGSFERQGQVWVEFPPFAPGQNNRFTEVQRDATYLYLVDISRLDNNDSRRPFYLRLPIAGGMSEWSYPNPFQWQPLYPVKPKPP